MTRHTLFDEHVARGLLKVIGQSGYCLDEEAQEAVREVSDSQSRSETSRGSEVEPSGESADAVEGDLAARRLFALTAPSAEVLEPSPVAELTPDSGLWAFPPAADLSGELSPLPQVGGEPGRGAKIYGSNDSMPRPKPWCLALAEAAEPTRQLIGWLASPPSWVTRPATPFASATRS